MTTKTPNNQGKVKEWEKVIKKDGWEKRYNEQFNQANAFLVFKLIL